MSGLVEQIKALTKGATMDDLQALIEDAMESTRESLGSMKERCAEMDDADPEKQKMEKAISGIERTLSQYDEMRAKAIEKAKAELDSPS